MNIEAIKELNGLLNNLKEVDKKAAQGLDSGPSEFYPYWRNEVLPELRRLRRKNPRIPQRAEEYLMAWSVKNIKGLI